MTEEEIMRKMACMKIQSDLYMRKYCHYTVYSYSNKSRPLYQKIKRCKIKLFEYGLFGYSVIKFQKILEILLKFKEMITDINVRQSGYVEIYTGQYKDSYDRMRDCYFTIYLYDNNDLRSVCSDIIEKCKNSNSRSDRKKCRELKLFVERIL